MSFNLIETTIADVHAAYKSGELTCRQLVQMYLDRIEAYDKKGPAINAIISMNGDALKEADRLDAAFKSSGFVGPSARHPHHHERPGRRGRYADDSRIGAVQELLPRS